MVIFVHRTQEMCNVLHLALQNDEKAEIAQKTLFFPSFYAIMLAEKDFRALIIGGKYYDQRYPRKEYG